MPITLVPDTRKRLLVSLKRYVIEELEQDLGDLKAGALLDYVVKEIGPAIYNKAIADAQMHLQKNVLDLEGVCFEKEFTYWAEQDAHKRKKAP